MSANTTIVPWDFSNHSIAALQFARRQFRDQDIEIVSVLETPNPYHPGFNWGPEAEKTAAANCRHSFFAESKISPDSGIKFIVRFGEPSEQIVQYANDENAACIVMSTHGHSGIKRLMLGSIAQKVLALASCPVILLPNNWFQSLSTNPESIQKQVLTAKSQPLK